MLNNLFFGLLLAYIFLSVYLMWRYWFAPNDTERLKWLTRLVLLSLLPQF